MADIQQIGSSIAGNLTGAHPTDFLGSLIKGARGWLQNETKADPMGGPPTGKGFKVYLPTDKAGALPETYQPNEEKIKSILSDPASGQQLLGLPPTKELEGPLTDDEYAKLETLSSKGNQLAMNLLDAYKPKYGPTGTQFEQSLTKPFTEELNQLPSMYNQLQEQQSQMDNQLPSALAQIQQTAKEYSGISPQAPNSQTTALMNSYLGTANNAIQASNPIMTSALKDLGTAAEISVKTFPYTTLIEDLLNRYAYQIESPSYPAPALQMPGISNAIQKLFTAATGSQLGATGAFAPPSAIGTPDNSGLTTPALVPASNPSSTG